MSEAWAVVAAVGAATVVLRAVGPALLVGGQLPRRLTAAVRLLAPALLAALVMVQVVGGDREIVLDERLVGVAAALMALFLRAPMLLVIFIAALVTAGIRLAV